MPFDDDPFRNNEQANRKFLGHRLRDERLRKGWSLEEVARRIGYTRKLGKGMNRIARVEESGTGGKEFLDKLAEVLGLSISGMESEIKDQMKVQRELWLAKWLNENLNAPVASHFIIRYFAGFYGSHALPSDIQKPTQAVEYARRFVRDHGRKICLPLTPTISIWLDNDGNVEFLTDAALGQMNLPSVRIERG